MRKILLCLIPAVALCQCSPKPEADTASQSAAAPKAVSFAYDIALSVTPAAAAKLQARKEKITISAMYYGNVTPATQAMADPSDGTLHLNTDVVSVDPVSQTVHMTGAGVDPARLKYTVGQKPLVQINVFSGPKLTPANLIQCDVFQDYVSSAQAKPLPIHCDLK